MDPDTSQKDDAAKVEAGVSSDSDLDLALRGFQGTPDDIERQWFEKIYTGRGDRQRQLTWRAVLMGGVLGMFMSISNLYTTLKLSWLFGVAITACVLSFVIWNALRALSGGRLSQMSILENNCMQSTASAAGYSTGSTVGTAFGALLLIEGFHRPWYIIAPFVLFTAALGVFVAIPMKRQMINQEQLRFPSGIASAETLRSLYSKGAEALQKAWALLVALAVGGVVGLLRTYGTLVEQLRLNGRPQILAFHISLGLGFIAVAFSFIAALVCCRATGETDTTPIGPMGKLTQLLYAVLPGAKGIASVNLMAAGVTAAAGGVAADLLTDLKSGYILGANPRKQFLAQFAGVFFGTAAIVPAWYAMVPNKQALEAFNPPATYMWKAVADLLTQGIQMLPATAVWAIVIGAILGVALPVAGNVFPKAAPYLPSAMGLGLSWVLVFQNSLSFALGAVLVALWNKYDKRRSALFSIPIASGLIAGESLVAALIAIACTIVGLALRR